MSRKYRFPIVLALACFSISLTHVPFSSADGALIIEKSEEITPDDPTDDSPPEDEGGDPEEILIRSRPAPPQEDKLVPEYRHSSPLEWLLRITNLVRTLR